MLNIEKYIDFAEYYFCRLVIIIGMIMRLVWHILIPVGVYIWIDPEFIGDVPFSQLTLNMIGSNIISILVPVGALASFFNFPDTGSYIYLNDEYKTEIDVKILELKSSPYFDWAKGSIAVIFVLFLIFAWMDS